MSSMHLSAVRRWLLQSPPVEWAHLQLRDLLIGALRQGQVPQHIAMVMDGNRRFARSRQIEIVEGHNLGFEAMAKILEVCYKCGVKVVTIYAFSIENFKRSRYEVDALMALAKLKLTQLAQHGELLHRYGARVRVLGQRELLAPDVRAAVDRAVELTRRNGDAVLNVCFPYTARDEMTAAVRGVVDDYARPSPRAGVGGHERAFSQTHIERNICSRHLSAEAAADGGGGGGGGTDSPSSGAASDAEDLAALSTLSSASTLQPPTPPDFAAPKPSSHGGDVEREGTGDAAAAPLAFPDPEAIDATTLTDRMFTASMPPVDLLIRTSGVERLSDFLLWQVHQRTEVVFLKCMWPEFDLWSFLPVLVEWQRRRRKESEERWGVRRRGRGDVKVE